MKKIKVEILEDLKGHKKINTKSLSDRNNLKEILTNWEFSGHLKGYFSEGEFEGWLKNGKLNESGILRASDFEYYGDFEENKAHGFGIYKNFEDMPANSIERTIPFKYYGEFENGEINGYGAILFLNGIQYFGEFKNSLFNGMGVLNNPDSRYYAGEFQANMFHGFGMLQLSDEYFYIGKFEFDEIRGCGIISNGNSNFIVSEFNSQSSIKILFADSQISLDDSTELLKQLASNCWSVSDCFNSKPNKNTHFDSVKKNTAAFFNFIHFLYMTVTHEGNRNNINSLIHNDFFYGDLFIEDWYTDEVQNESHSFREGVKVGEYSCGSFNGIALKNQRHYYDIGHFEKDCMFGTGIQIKHFDWCALGFFENNELNSGLYLDDEDGYTFQITIDSTLNTMCYSFNKSSPFDCTSYIYEKETGEHLGKKHFNFREWK